MTDWSKLSDVYGPATGVPILLQRLEYDPDAPVWGELWSRLCHQGSVGEASYAALPHLERLARGWPPLQRTEPLVLAAAIISSAPTAALGSPDDVRGQVEALTPRLLELAEESLAVPGLPEADFIYLLEATRSLMGDHLWGDRLEGLVDGEFDGACPACRRAIRVVMSEHGRYVTIGEWGDDEPREQILAAEELPADGAWMARRAQATAQTGLVELLSYLFGSSSCPYCHAAFELPVALATDPDDPPDRG